MVFQQGLKTLFLKTSLLQNQLRPYTDVAIGPGYKIRIQKLFFFCQCGGGRLRFPVIMELIMSFVITGTALRREFTVWALLVVDFKNSAYFRRSAVVWADRKRWPASCTRPEGSVYKLLYSRT